jgi:hypothetical protein
LARHVLWPGRALVSVDWRSSSQYHRQEIVGMIADLYRGREIVRWAMDAREALLCGARDDCALELATRLRRLLMSGQERA